MAVTTIGSKTEKTSKRQRCRISLIKEKPIMVSGNLSTASAVHPQIGAFRYAGEL